VNSLSGCLHWVYLRLTNLNVSSLFKIESFIKIMQLVVQECLPWIDDMLERLILLLLIVVRGLSLVTWLCCLWSLSNSATRAFFSEHSFSILKFILFILELTLSVEWLWSDCLFHLIKILENFLETFLIQLFAIGPKNKILRQSYALIMKKAPTVLDRHMRPEIILRFHIKWSQGVYACPALYITSRVNEKLQY